MARVRERWLARCERGVFDVALEHLFQGSALNAVDAKGRVSIPAFLRGVIERRGDARTIVLAKHEAFPCLSAYDPAYAALKHAKLERLLEKEETSPDAAARISAAQPHGLRRHRGSPLRQLRPHPLARR